MQKRTVAGVTAVAAAGALAAGIVSLAQERRVDDLVRADFFAGFAGNSDALERGMRLTEEMLEADPGNAAALVWHGAGTFFRSGASFESGDFRTGIALWEQGLTEMARAVEMAPDDVEVLIPRGANLIVGSRFVPPAQAEEILRTGVADFERVLELQAPYFSRLGVHARGELLTGLADGWSRLGDREAARRYFERIVDELEGSVYEQKARAWLEDRPEAREPGFFECSGCHR
ncbi:MAG: hypothetical protein OXH75_08725 [Acidobacteria bacterium]|nr:hypothetical protein [Acidobacteriota bacterium]